MVIDHVESIAEPEPGFSEVGVQFQRLAICGERVLVTSDFAKNVAAPEPSLGEAGIQFQRLVKRGQQLIEAPLSLPKTLPRPSQASASPGFNSSAFS